MAAAALAFTGIAHADNHAGAPIQYFINKFDGEAKYPADLEYYPYLNPEAPIYGEYVSGVRGGFNDFNSLNGRGEDASGLGLLSDSLIRILPSPSEPRRGGSASSYLERRGGSSERPPPVQCTLLG